MTTNETSGMAATGEGGTEVFIPLNKVGEMATQRAQDFEQRGPAPYYHVAKRPTAATAMTAVASQPTILSPVGS